MLVWRHRGGAREWLLLHRAMFGADFEGEWAWSSPGGWLDADEEPAAGARRELVEETGLDLPLEPAAIAHEQVAFFVGEASDDAEVRLSTEHDRFEWVSTDEASSRCLPAWVGDIFARFA